MQSKLKTLPAPVASGLKNHSSMSRRHFLSAAAAAGISAPYIIPSGVLAAPGKLGANDRVRLGVIGTGNRVTWLAANWCDPSQTRFVGFADCSTPKLNAFVSVLKNKFPEVATCPRYEDYREMLDKEKLDGVFITTPPHSRVLPCIHACQAGIDIYAEKPVTLTISEGQTLMQAVEIHKRVFQSGTQARSIAINDWSVEQIQQGVIGEVRKVIAPNFDVPVDYRPLKNAGVAPADVNWDLWCSQAPLVPFDARIAARLEEGWAPYREFDGGGDRWGMTGFGTHTFDQILWGLGKEAETPLEFWPNKTQDKTAGVSMRFADGVVIEMMDETRKGPAFGGIFIGTDGKLEINRARVATNPVEIAQQAPAFASEHTDGITHVQNWIDCIRTRDETRCPVRIAHRQSVICHIINVVRELGRKLQYDSLTDRFVGDDEANLHPSVLRARRNGYELPSVV